MTGLIEGELEELRPNEVVCDHCFLVKPLVGVCECRA